MPLLDTRRRNENDLTSEFVADNVLQLMSYTAQIERDLIVRRTTEGITAAASRGVKLGRRPLPRPKNYNALRQKWLAGKISSRKAAEQLGVSHFTFLKWVHE